jgi:DNA-binding SARP family transcriptional activator/Tfp pilus assembly protein PilF
LEARAAGRVLDLGGVRQRRVLAALLLNPNRTINASRLVEVAWDEDPPATARRQIQNRIAALRAILTRHGGFIDTTDSGYRLRVGPDELDAHRFDDLVAGGRAAGDTAALRAALALWRGPALAGLGGTVLEREATVLEERRLGVIEECLELELAAGMHADVVAELRTLVAENPLRERFVRQLMLALHRSGRQAEALAAYQELARRLADELGVDPAPELRQQYEAVLRENAGPRPVSPHAVPSQLPADVAAFTGRVADLARLDQLLSDGQAEPSVVISTITGTAGVGKTALAIHWAHRVRERFTDGQLYINLRGYDTGPPLKPIEALGRFLRALGVQPEKVPSDVDEAASLYRTLLTERRVLVLLDNAVSAEQLRPLLPGSATSLALVTSREALTGLVARDGAKRLALDALVETEAQALLVRILGADQVAAEPREASELCRLCGYLPLALRIAAANLAGGGGSIARYVADLSAGDRLAALEVGGDEQAAVRAAFGRSYAALPDPAQRMFRLLALAPGPDADLHAAAALAGTTTGRARPLLDRLVSAHLVDERRPGRFSYHDLLRLYATDLVDATDRRAALERLLDFYVQTAHRAALLLFPQRDAVAPPPGQHLPVPTFGEPADALAWFSAEHLGLVEAVGLAAAEGFDRAAWQLAWNMTDYFYRQGHWPDMAFTQRHGLTAAQRLGDVAGQARLERGLANAHLRLNRYAEARHHFDRSLGFYVADEDRVGQARAYLDLMSLSEREDRLDDSLGYGEQALEVSRAAGYDTGQARALNMIGWLFARRGDYEAALHRCEQALELQRVLGDSYGEANTWDSVGYVRHHLGDFDGATVAYRNSVQIHREIGSRAGQAVVSGRLADVHLAAGDEKTARQLWRTALDILDELDHPAAEGIRTKLRS